ncbi:MAG: hypothetical protein K0R08_2214 [Solimicrobium sp.]|nr:hypothetical protein [Solimicrobium sp.]
MLCIPSDLDSTSPAAVSYRMRISRHRDRLFQERDRSFQIDRDR